jgi:tRNA dimethylallyltransferase
MVGGTGLYLKAVWEGLNHMPEVEASIREKLNFEFQEKGIVPLQQELREADPAYYERVDVHNHIRLIRALEVIRQTGQPFSVFYEQPTSIIREFKNIKFGVTPKDRELLYQRIDQRMDEMIDAGLFEEAKSLQPYSALTALHTVGYQEIFPFFEGEYDRNETIRLLKRNSRRYAKRQLTWFRKYSDILWVEPTAEKLMIRRIAQQLDA